MSRDHSSGVSLGCHSSHSLAGTRTVCLAIFFLSLLFGGPLDSFQSLFPPGNSVEPADAQGERRGTGGDLGGDADVHLEQPGEAWSQCRHHVGDLSTDSDGDGEGELPQRNCGRGLAVDEQWDGGTWPVAQKVST